jgi:hypothetical protein
MESVDAELSSTKNPTRNLTEQRELSTEVGSIEPLEPNTPYSPPLPPPSGSDSAVPHNSDHNVYGFDTGGIAVRIITRL